MIPRSVAESALQLSDPDRLALAHLLVDSISSEQTERADTDALREAIRRIDEVANGTVRGLSEQEFRRALA